MTPSETALAKILAAWEAWPGTIETENEDVDAALLGTADVLLDLGFLELDSGTEQTVLSAHGTAVLDRARKAGVLP